MGVLQNLGTNVSIDDSLVIVTSELVIYIWKHEKGFVLRIC